MKQKSGFFLLILFLALFVSCNNGNDSGLFYHPSDFDPSASTCFIWTTDFYEIIPELAGIISTRDKVTLYIGENEDLNQIESLLKKYNANLINIHFEKLKEIPDNAWLRDYGPAYLMNGRGDKKIVNFSYFGSQQIFNNQIAAKMNVPVVQSTLNSTGGAREVNGKGTVILCEAHELDVNKTRTKQEIENEIIKNLKLKNVIWLKQGIPQDDSELGGPIFDQIYPNGVNGHVDEFCRFVDASTIFISSVTDEEAKMHPILADAKKRLDENYNILINSHDQDGNKFNVVKVPFAPLLVFERSVGDSSKFLTSVTSYMNFIITNSFVILPSYTSSSKEFDRQEILLKENEVERIFKKFFPNKEIIKVQATELNNFSGGFHCVSINKPLAVK